LKQIVAFVQKTRGRERASSTAPRAPHRAGGRSAGRPGLSARPYHGRLTATERTENQDCSSASEVRIMCATIAFGMGINKPQCPLGGAHDLPKNIEGYYRNGPGPAAMVCRAIACCCSAARLRQADPFHSTRSPTNTSATSPRPSFARWCTTAKSAGCRRAELLG